MEWEAGGGKPCILPGVSVDGNPPMHSALNVREKDMATCFTLYALMRRDFGTGLYTWFEKRESPHPAFPITLPLSLPRSAHSPALFGESKHRENPGPPESQISSFSDPAQPLRSGRQGGAFAGSSGTLCWSATGEQPLLPTRTRDAGLVVRSPMALSSTPYRAACVTPPSYDF